MLAGITGYVADASLGDVPPAAAAGPNFIQQRLDNPTPTDGDRFGTSVAVSGDTAIVGLDRGGVAIFTRTGVVWSLEQEIVNPPPAGPDVFGWSVALSGDTAIVSNPRSSTGGIEQVGTVYVYTRSGTAWSLEQEINNPSPAESDQFGWSVAVSGDTVVVGASGDDAGALDAGSVYVYTRSGTAWSLEQEINNPSPAESEEFGSSVALSGDTVVVGASRDNTGAIQSGSVYVYTRSGTAWSLEQEIDNPTPSDFERFGSSVALSGDTVIVGAPNEDSGAIQSGSVYVYARSGTSWSLEREISNPTPSGDDRFGWSVAMSGDTVVVGVPSDDAGAPDAGAAYVVVVDDTDPTATITTPADGASFPVNVDVFADYVCADDASIPSCVGDVASGAAIDTATVGAHTFTVTATDGAGRNHVTVHDYTVTPVGVPNFIQQELDHPTPSSDDRFGWSVAVSGDTAIVGAILDGGFAGTASVYTRNGAGWVLEQQLNNPAPAPVDNFGQSVAISGDTAIVGAYRDDAGATDAGSAYVYRRTGTVWTLEQVIDNPDPVDLDYFGSAVAVSGDTAIVGSYGDDAGATDAGSAYVYRRVGTVWTLEEEINNPSPGAFDFFGQSVAISGGTAVVGAYRDDTGANDAGSAYVYTRAGTVWTLEEEINNPSPGVLDTFGRSVSLSGDTAIIGADGDDTGAADAGSAYIFTRSGGSWSLEQEVNSPTAATSGYFGFAVAISGNNVVIGSYGDDTGATDAGSVHVYTRAGTVWTLARELNNPSPGANDNFGRAVAIYGDTAVIGAEGDNAGAGSTHVLAVDDTDPVAGITTPADGSTWGQGADAFADYGCSDSDSGIASCVGDVSNGAAFDTSTVGTHTFAVTATDRVGRTTVAVSSYTVVAAAVPNYVQQEIDNPFPAAGDLFGSSVAISGDTAIVGMPGDDTPAIDAGSAHVYRRVGTEWSLEQGWGFPQADAGFGSSVAISGDTAIVGAPGYFAGFVQVYTRSGTAWTVQAAIYEPSLDVGDDFGSSVAISGDTAVVAAFNANTVYVYTRSGTTWSLQQEINDPGVFGIFGSSVALSGDTVIVGTIYSGAYVYTRSGETWSLEQAIDTATADIDWFGFSVALSGDTAVIGAPLAGAADVGSAYVYTRSGGSWSLEQQIDLTSPSGFDLFGSSVALSGDTAVIGTPGQGNIGSAYVYSRIGNGWVFERAFSSPTLEAFSEFGTAVAVSGDTAIVGAPSADDTGASDAGSVSILAYEDTDPTATITTPADGASFPAGAAVLADYSCADADSGIVSCVGDVPVGSAIDTATVGARTFTVDATDRVDRVGTTTHNYTVTAVAPPAALDADVASAALQAGDQSGTSVAISGTTAVVGAPFDDEGGTDAGAAYVFELVGSDWVEQFKLLPDDAEASDHFGISVAIFGNTIVVGSELDDDAGASSGSAYVFVGAFGLWAQQAKLTAADAATGDRFGGAVAISGDVAVIGAALDDDDGTSSGSAYVFVRDGATWAEQAKLTADDAAAGDGFGGSVGVFGTTAVVGAAGDDDAGSSSGSAYVFVRDGVTWPQETKLVAAAAAGGDQFGAAVAVSVNTVLVGAPRSDQAGTDSGSAYAFTRTGTTWSTGTDLPSPSGDAFDRYGESVAISGNTAVVGAPLDDSDGANAGAAHVHYRTGASWSSFTALASSSTLAGDQFGDAVGVSQGRAIVGARLHDGVDTNSGMASIFDDDTSDPSVAIATPADGATFIEGQAVTIDFVCTDGESGIDTCIGDAADGALLDTATVGPSTFTVTAVDKAGNTTVVTHGYEVAPAPPTPVVRPSLVAIVEGDSGSAVARLPVDLSAPSSTPVTVSWTTFDNGAPGIATAGADYVAASGTVTFEPGSVLEYVDITVFGDVTDDRPALFGEWAVVSFSNPVGATLDASFFGLGIVTILDDDDPPVVQGGIGAALEGDVGTSPLEVEVRLTTPSDYVVTVDFATFDNGALGVATAGLDYVAASGTVTFAPGETIQTVTIDVLGDYDAEPPVLFGEWVPIVLSNPTNATLATFTQSIGIIIDDD